MIALREEQKVIECICLECLKDGIEKKTKCLGTHLKYIHRINTERYLELNPGAEVSNPNYNLLVKVKIGLKSKGRPSTRKGKKDSDETKKKKSLSKMGDKNPNFGKHTWLYGLTKETDERVMKLALAQEGKIVSEETRKLMSDNHADISGDKNPSKRPEVKIKIKLLKLKLWEDLIWVEKQLKILKKTKYSGNSSLIQIKFFDKLKEEIKEVEPILEWFVALTGENRKLAGQCTYWLDIVYNKLKIDIEVDGTRWHADPNKYEPDDIVFYDEKTQKPVYAKEIWEQNRIRDLILIGLGWDIYRFTEEDLNKNMDECVKRVREIIISAIEDNKVEIFRLSKSQEQLMLECNYSKCGKY